MKKYFEVTPAAYVVFREQDNILLMRRANTGYFDGHYSLPAGHFEEGETATHVAVRESKEELGVDIIPEDLRLVHTMHVRSDTPVVHERIALFFETKAWSGEITNKEPHKCDDILWSRIDDLPPNMAPEVEYALGKIASGVIYSDFGF
jgi:ADP-ribose pyrophosphatase YjhB (NUDIX family)